MNKPVCVALIAALLQVQPVVGEQLRAGVATVDITPPIGYRMSGYFYERPETSAVGGK